VQEQTDRWQMTAPPAVATVPPAAWLVAVALGIVYVVWGSTYLAIRVLVEDLPPFASASWRYLVAGLLLGAVLALRGGVRRLRVARRELVGCAALGLLLPALGNGLVMLGEQKGAPSGIAALLIAAVPLWVIVYRRLTGDRPSARTLLGVLLGFAGLVVLIASQGISGDVPVVACLIIMGATVFWSLGSWSQPRLPLPKDAFVLAVYEMLFGSVWLLLLAAVRGEHLLPTSAPLDAWLAWAYLVTFGSVVAFTAYVWVLSVAPISLVATYAYVNPVVAVFLGWLILSEAVTMPIVIGGAVVVGAVAIVVSAERQKAQADQASTRSTALRVTE
jgi:drug/metabolite transporter (DMT)-like permease